LAAVLPRSLTGRLALMLLALLAVAFAMMGSAFIRHREFRADERLAMQAADRIVLAFEFVRTGQVRLRVETAGLRLQVASNSSSTSFISTSASSNQLFTSLLQAKLAAVELIDARVAPGFAARVRLSTREQVVATVVHTPPAHSAPPPPFAEFAGLAGALAVSMLWAIAAITKPLRRVAQAASLVSIRPGAARLDESGPAEVADVLRAFNHMHDRIDQQTTDQVRVLQGVSYDLKTPLTRLRFRIDKLADEALHKSISEDIDAMQKMVSSALSYLRTLE
jgi:signal transduction histidine kinase